MCIHRGSLLLILCLHMAIVYVLAEDQAYMGYERGPDGYHYKYHDRKVNWETAKLECASEGARLPIINNKATFAYLKQRMENMEDDRSVWLGAVDVNSNDKWRWVNGQKVVMEVRYGDGDESRAMNYWWEGEPDNWYGKEDCMMTKKEFQGRFADGSCESKETFLCQKVNMGYEREPGGYFYKYHEKRVNWEAAKLECTSEGARLAIINNKVTFSYLKQRMEYMKDDKWVWLGAVNVDENSNTKWKWVNGQEVVMTATGYGDSDKSRAMSYWQRGEPNSLNSDQEDCMMTKKEFQGRFADGNCAWTETFLCQKGGTEDRRTTFFGTTTTIFLVLFFIVFIGVFAMMITCFCKMRRRTRPNRPANQIPLQEQHRDEPV